MMKKNVYTIVSQEDETKIFETLHTIKEAKKAFRNFYYWNPSEKDGIMLYKNGSIYSEEYALTNPEYN